MTPHANFSYEFVEFIPDQLKERTLYIAVAFATAAHQCACGCGREVVTPLSPTDWALTFDGKTVSLSPSIGNWGFPCRSHYWIRRNRIRWATPLSQDEIDAGRRHDQQAKRSYFDGSTEESAQRPDRPTSPPTKKRGRWKKRFTAPWR